MDTTVGISGYTYSDGELNSSHDYLLPSLLGVLTSLALPVAQQRVFELGCGNGAVAAALTKVGYHVTGVDVSTQGLEQAQRRHPELFLRLGSAYDRLADLYGRFPVVVSLEVVEHLYAPRAFAKTLHDLLEPAGTAIVSTPYHSYWKNLALALTGKMDQHFTALWDHGHIKFWSEKTLMALLVEAGFQDIVVKRIGRIPILAKSMMVIAKKP